MNAYFQWERRDYIAQYILAVVEPISSEASWEKI